MPIHPNADQQFGLNYMHHYLQRRGMGDVEIELVSIDEIEQQKRFASNSARPAQLGGRRDGYYDRPLRDNQVEFRPRREEAPALEYRMAADDSDSTTLERVAAALRVKGA